MSRFTAWYKKNSVTDRKAITFYNLLLKNSSEWSELLRNGLLYFFRSYNVNADLCQAPGKVELDLKPGVYGSIYLPFSTNLRLAVTES